MHNAIDPPVEETINFTIDTGLSTTNNEKLDMRIYPNPVNENFVTIISPVQGLKEIEVYSVTGRKVMNTSTHKSTLNLSSFNTGFYMIKVTINAVSYTHLTLPTIPLV